MAIAKPSTGPEMFAALREQLFGGLRAPLGDADLAPGDVLGVVVEMGMSKGTALEGRIRASLQANDGASPTNFEFTVTKQPEKGGPLRIEITPLRA